MSEGLLRIGEVAGRAGVSPRTVDFYTSLGLLSPADRTSGNFRLYAADAVDRVTAIRRLESNGVRLDDIASALSQRADRPAVTDLFGRLDRDLHLLQGAAQNAAAQDMPADAYGLLAAIAARTHSLITLALDIAAGVTPSV